MSEMMENDRDRSIHQLYGQFKASKGIETKPTSTVGNLVERIRVGLKGNKKSAELTTERIRQQIIEQIRYRPGKYPLTELTYGPTNDFGTHLGFMYSFDYFLGEDKFPVGCFHSNHSGIPVQKHLSGFTPTIEVLGIKDKRGVILLHLPEGFQIPVGPLNFEEDSLPMSEEEVSANKAKAFEMAKAADIKVVDKNIETVSDAFDEVFNSSRHRKYTDRYFFWQPILPTETTRIAIDFGGIKPPDMGLTPKDAPVFHNTIIIKDKNL